MGLTNPDWGEWINERETTEDVNFRWNRYLYNERLRLQKEHGGRNSCRCSEYVNEIKLREEQEEKKYQQNKKLKERQDILRREYIATFDTKTQIGRCIDCKYYKKQPLSGFIRDIDTCSGYGRILSICYTVRSVRKRKQCNKYELLEKKRNFDVYLPNLPINSKVRIRNGDISTFKGEVSVPEYMNGQEYLIVHNNGNSTLVDANGFGSNDGYEYDYDVVEIM